MTKPQDFNEWLLENRLDQQRFKPGSIITKDIFERTPPQPGGDFNDNQYKLMAAVFSEPDVISFVMPALSTGLWASVKVQLADRSNVMRRYSAGLGVYNSNKKLVKK